MVRLARYELECLRAAPDRGPALGVRREGLECLRAAPDRGRALGVRLEGFVLVLDPEPRGA